MAVQLITRGPPNWADDTHWVSGSYGLAWNGTAWEYNGDYGGCDACSRELISIGTWAVDFRPTMMELTFTVPQEAPFNNGYIQMQDVGYNNIISYTPITGITAIGTYIKTFALDFTNNLDIMSFGIFLGECVDDGGINCVDQDRPWTLTSIVFS